MSAEALYREDFESDALIPCVISSIVAYSIYMGVFGISHIFALPNLLFTDVRELAFYLILGLVCALGGSSTSGWASGSSRRPSAGTWDCAPSCSWRC